MRGWFGPFRIERQVGRGGLGQVYRAVDSRTGATVALKLLPPGGDPLGGLRMQREFQALRALRHPHLERVLDVGEEGGTPWLSMEYVEGLGVREWLASLAPAAEPLEPEPGGEAHGSEGVDLDVLFDEPDSDALLAAARARKLLLAGRAEQELSEGEQRRFNHPARVTGLCEALAQIADGLAEVHALDLVHRDVKPGNILVAGGHRAVLMDFGLVKSLSEAEDTDAGKVVGTWRYMSPEQARGERVDARADLYSLGATLYELVSGRPPFPYEGNYRLLEAVVGEMPAEVHRINPGAPMALCALAHRLLAKNRGTRPGDAREVAAMLRAVGRKLGAPPSSPPPPNPG